MKSSHFSSLDILWSGFCSFCKMVRGFQFCWTAQGSGIPSLIMRFLCFTAFLWYMRRFWFLFRLLIIYYYSTNSDSYLAIYPLMDYRSLRTIASTYPCHECSTLLIYDSWNSCVGSVFVLLPLTNTSSRFWFCPKHGRLLFTSVCTLYLEPYKHFISSDD